ncbi:MAG: LamG domain-containing protein [Deltaproteobacteria bacterium]|nr:LamG domain-containing protein [Deltaproteobacteria bacterium]
MVGRHIRLASAALLMALSGCGTDEPGVFDNGSGHDVSIVDSYSDSKPVEDKGPVSDTCAGDSCKPVGCESDQDCEGDLPHCNKVTGMCVECVADAQCPGVLKVCNDAVGVCVGCLDDGDCPVDLPHCRDQGLYCVGCLKDDDCAEPTPVCEPFIFQCVQCTSPGDCHNPLPVCDTAIHACRGCKDQSECAGSLTGWMCDQGSGRCVSCLNDDHCLPPAPMCDLEEGKCVACGSDQDCADPTPKCDPIGGGCVECLQAGDCAQDAWSCNMEHKCVECAKDQDCKDPAKPYCSPFTSKCGECVTNDDCQMPGKPACDQDNGVCAECLGSWDCVFPSPTCDVATKTCVECVSSANCPSAEPICADEGFCVECLQDDDCGAEEPLCDQLNHRCVLCKGDSDCHPDQPFCATAYGTCNACMSPSGCPYGQKCFFSMCKSLAAGPDNDDDTVENSVDNCPDKSNWSQDDMDGDGIGDACDDDIDGDLVPDSQDNCPYIKNPDQSDQDKDGWGDACEGSGIGGDKNRTCATLGFDTAVQFLEGFESGKFFGWTVYSGIAGSWTPGSVMSFIPPQVASGSAHQGAYGARFPNVTWPDEVNHDAYLTLCMPMGVQDRLSVWIRPDKVGYCCGPYGTAGFNIAFAKGTQGYSITYSWSYSSNKDSKTHKFVRLTEAPFQWQAGQWNHLDVVLQDELNAYFQITDFGNVMITQVHVYNHYSNGSPKGFDIDDIELIPQP